MRRRERDGVEGGGLEYPPYFFLLISLSSPSGINSAKPPLLSRCTPSCGKAEAWPRQQKSLWAPHVVLYRDFTDLFVVYDLSPLNTHNDRRAVSFSRKKNPLPIRGTLLCREGSLPPQLKSNLKMFKYSIQVITLQLTVSIFSLHLALCWITQRNKMTSLHY